MIRQRRAPRGGARKLALAFTGALALAPGVAHADDGAPAFHCDGTDPSLFLERQEAGWVGYGETWDHDTCAEGSTTIYAPGARQWAAMRPDWSYAAASSFDAQFYATVFPVVVFGGVAAVFGIAWLAAFVHRRRRVRVVTMACPSCSTAVPVHLDDPALRNLFCPACGAPCEIVDDGRQAGDPATAGAA